MKELTDWIAQNKEWFLSGIGIAVPIALAGWWINTRKSVGSQSQKTGDHSLNVQAHGNVSIESEQPNIRAKRNAK